MSYPQTHYEVCVLTFEAGSPVQIAPLETLADAIGVAERMARRHPAWSVLVFRVVGEEVELKMVYEEESITTIGEPI